MKYKDIVFDVPDSSTDYKDILTSISHYELTISDSKALKELLKYNNIKASCSGAFYDKDGINSMYLFIPFVDSAVASFLVIFGLIGLLMMLLMFTFGLIYKLLFIFTLFFFLIINYLNYWILNLNQLEKAKHCSYFLFLHLFFLFHQYLLKMS